MRLSKRGTSRLLRLHGVRSGFPRRRTCRGNGPPAKKERATASLRASVNGKYRKLYGQPRTHARPHTPAGEWRPTRPRLSLPFWPSTRRYASTSATVGRRRNGPSRCGVKRAEGYASWCSFPHGDFGPASAESLEFPSGASSRSCADRLQRASTPPEVFLRVHWRACERPLFY
jgi:hypothetical protein